MKTRILLLILIISSSAFAQSGIYHTTFTVGDQTLTLEILDDDLAHFELGQESVETIWTSPMVAKTDYTGPTEINFPSEGVIETPQMRIEVDNTTLCVTVTDLKRELLLTMVCPMDGGLSFTQEGTTDIYGLGEQFKTRGGTEGNWIGGRRRSLNTYGNALMPYNGGNVASAQFPIMYALGEGTENYVLFLDDIYQHYWDFSADPFTVTTTNEVVRWYIMTGDNLPDLRRDYMELTGFPPVPPRQMFGLWVSEYGYENWEEAIEVLDSLKAANFPVDGIVLDLLWFGGIGANSQIGSLAWDETNFPNPAEMIETLKTEYGVSLMTIEESYVASILSDFDELTDVLVRECQEATCEPVELNSWWGRGGMVDWTNPKAAAWWHDNRRQHLIDTGIIGHWTDLGEPEDFDQSAWYYGFPELDLHSHADIHNIYNLLWSKSIWEAYQRLEIEQRPFILSRSGTSGSQRYGVAMWSGDIGGNLGSLAAHMNVQMHMSLSGIDYFGSDIGGFFRQADLPSLGEGGTYTLWFANSALLDVPLRPHTLNLQNIYETAPSLVGDVASNLANTRLRYELSPYLYTLAHRAYRNGEPMFAPLVYHFQDDPNVRMIGAQKMIGTDLMMVTVTTPDLNAVPVYLPAGGWFNYYTGDFFQSKGEWIEVTANGDGLIRAPLFVRDGAVLPLMVVDDQTKNLLGDRRDGSTPHDLIINVYSHDVEEGTFTLIEDDGQTMAYQEGEVMETPIVYDGESVVIGTVSGTYNSAPQTRPVEIRLINGVNEIEPISGTFDINTPLELPLAESVTP